MILVSGNIRCMRILGGLLLAVASNESGVFDEGNFWQFQWLLLRSETSEIRPINNMTICCPFSAGNLLQNEWPWMTLSGYDVKIRFRRALCCRIDASLQPNAEIWMKTDPYYQGQQCRPMTLVSGSCGYSRRFVLAGTSNDIGGCRRRQFLAISVEYVFENSRYTARNIIWRYSTPCRPVSECKMNDLEWPWVASSCQNPFSASTAWIRAFECQKIIQPLRFCGVLCIAPCTIS